MDAINPPESLIFVHAIAGLLAMLAPVVAILAPKPLKAGSIPTGGRWPHRIAGLVYVLAMLILSVTAVPLAFYQWNSVLLIILFLSFYLTLSAVCEIRFPAATRMRTVMAAGLTCASVAVAAFSLRLDDLTTSAVTLAFSAAAVGLSLRDLFGKSARSSVRSWLASHMMRMLASFTLTVTVYSILNFESVTLIWRCVLPIAAGGLLSGALMTYYLRSGKKGGG